jgi:uncharacterized coiled-coil protein SlyX
MNNVNQQKISFTETEVESINRCIAELEQIFQNKTVQLTSTQSHFYGKLGKEKEKWAEEMHKDATLDPHLIPSYVDVNNWNELEKLRETLNGMVNRFSNITTQLVHTNRVVGYNLFQECKSVYEYAKLMSGKNMPGFILYFTKWAYIFSKKSKVKTVKPEGTNG